MMNDRVDQDATHAWAEVWVGDLGWIGFDVSNGISPDMRYVRIATGLDYSQAAPISGMTLGGSGELIDVTVQVQQ
jgi:transglutaminase-like putative cysteine protease